MDFKTKMIEYLENKIKGCEELEMDSEKWAFIQCLLKVRKLSEDKKDETSNERERLIAFQAYQMKNNVGHSLNTIERSVDIYLKQLD